MLPAPSLQNHSIPPRITEKSCRLRVSNRTMVGVLEPSRVACVASGPKASNHRVMKPSNRYRRLPWSVKSMSRTQSLSRSQIGLDANRHIHLLSERTEGIFFLDIPSHRTRPARISIGKAASRDSDCRLVILSADVTDLSREGYWLPSTPRTDPHERSLALAVLISDV